MAHRGRTGAVVGGGLLGLEAADVKRIAEEILKR